MRRCVSVTGLVSMPGGPDSHRDQRARKASDIASLWNCDFGQQLACDIVAIATAMTRRPLHAMTHDTGPDGLHVFGQDIVTRIEERPSARFRGSS